MTECHGNEQTFQVHYPQGDQGIIISDYEQEATEFNFEYWGHLRIINSHLRHLDCHRSVVKLTSWFRVKLNVFLVNRLCTSHLTPHWGIPRANKGLRLVLLFDLGSSVVGECTFLCSFAIEIAGWAEWGWFCWGFHLWFATSFRRLGSLDECSNEKHKGWTTDGEGMILIPQCCALTRLQGYEKNPVKDPLLLRKNYI